MRPRAFPLGILPARVLAEICLEFRSCLSVFVLPTEAGSSSRAGSTSGWTLCPSSERPAHACLTAWENEGVRVRVDNHVSWLTWNGWL